MPRSSFSWNIKNRGTMQRQLKFRCWDNMLNELSVFIKVEDGKSLFHICSINEDKDRFIITQFTGLPDCDGKEIFEYDILQLLHDGRRRTILVEFEYGFYGFEIVGKDYREFIPLRECEELKLLGNIFQNPDLLEHK